MKTIGIYTFHAETNFGAQLQAFATERFLNGNGFVAEVVNIMTPKQYDNMHYCSSWHSFKGVVFNLLTLFSPSIKRKIANLNSFHDSIKLSKRFSSFEEVAINCPEYDVHIVGSDQVWNFENDFNQFYLLPFLPQEAKRLSYASSFGSINIKEEYFETINDCLNRFAAISVRERDAVDFINRISGLKAKHVVDPTFLLNSKEWSSVVGNMPIIKEPYILYYGFDNNDNCRQIIASVREKFKLPLVGVASTTSSPYKYDIFVKDAGPKEFINLILNCQFVITSSFHGMALSINFRKDFIVLSNGTRMSRMESALESFGIRNRIVLTADDALNRCNTPINYELYESRICNQISESKQWLLSELNCIV